MPNPSLFSVLARSLLAGEAAVEKVIARASQTLGRSWPWLRPLAKRYVDDVAHHTRPRQRDVVQFLRHHPGLRRALAKHGPEISVEHWLAEEQKMARCRGPGVGCSGY